MDSFISEVLQPLSVFGGIALIVWVSSKARLEHLKLERGWMQKSFNLPSTTQQDNAVLEELKALKKQISEMQSTGHQFDISFDQALTRLEERVNRMESTRASDPITPTNPEEPQTQRLGR